MIISKWSVYVCMYLYVPEACNFIKKETLAQVFSCEFCEISKNTFPRRTLPVPASAWTFSVMIYSKLRIIRSLKFYKWLRRLLFCFWFGNVPTINKQSERNKQKIGLISKYKKQVSVCRCFPFCFKESIYMLLNQTFCYRKKKL